MGKTFQEEVYNRELIEQESGDDFKSKKTNYVIKRDGRESRIKENLTSDRVVEFTDLRGNYSASRKSFLDEEPKDRFDKKYSSLVYGLVFIPVVSPIILYWKAYKRGNRFSKKVALKNIDFHLSYGLYTGLLLAAGGLSGLIIGLSIMMLFGLYGAYNVYSNDRIWNPPYTIGSLI